MPATIRAIRDDDWPSVAAIFNHYVANSLAAYPDHAVEEDFFRLRRQSHPEYPFLVADDGERVAGFAYLSPFHPAATLRRSAQLTYFIDPSCTGAGLGTRFLEARLEAGRRMGIVCFLAHISSTNEGSIRFHARHGFSECGRFLEVGEKAGQIFDMVWMQRLER